MKRTMQSMLTALVVGGVAVGLPAQAADAIDTAAFSLVLGGSTPDQVTLELLSATADSVHIRLDNLQASTFVLTSGQGIEVDEETVFSYLTGQVHAGYQITSMAFNFTVSGNLDVPIYESCAGCTLVDAGLATNEGNYGFKVAADSTTNLDTDADFSLDGMQFHTLNDVRPLTGNFSIETLFDTASNAAPLIWRQTTPLGEIDHVEASTASFFIGNAELVFQIAPVPEPGTYGMMLTGLGLLALAARRRAN